jgi:hypothetical protein
MHIVIVGQRNGRAVVQWSRFVGLCLGFSMILGSGTGLGFFLLAGYWSHTAVLFGIFVGAGIGWVGLIAGLKTPPKRLPVLDPRGAGESD